MTTWYGNSVIEQVYSTITNTLESDIPSIIKFLVVFNCHGSFQFLFIYFYQKNFVNVCKLKKYYL